MDYNMPEMNGLDATKVILDLQNDLTANPDLDVSIVGLTANSSSKMRKECLEAGQK